MITIDLTDPTDYPPSGRYQTTTRWQHGDRDLVDLAADQLGMATAEFIRTVTLQAANQVLNEGGDEPPK